MESPLRRRGARNNNKSASIIKGKPTKQQIREYTKMANELDKAGFLKFCEETKFNPEWLGQLDGKDISQSPVKQDEQASIFTGSRRQPDRSGKNSRGKSSARNKDMSGRKRK